MVEAEWYSLVSVASSGIAVVLAAYVLRRIPNRRAGDAFVMAMAFFLLAAVFAHLLRTSTLDPAGSNEVPLLFARLFYFFHMLAVGFVAAFLGAYFLGFQLLRRRGVNLGLQISLLAIAILVAAQVAQLESEAYYGVVVESPGALLSLAAFASVYALLAITTLLKTLVSNQDPIVRKQALLMLGGILIHAAAAEPYAYSRIVLDAYPPPLLTVSALAMATLFAFALLRFRMFVVSPRNEDPVPYAPAFDLKPGRAYFVREHRPTIAFQALAEATRRGRPGLVVTRLVPDAVREDYDLPETPILWLTSTMGTNRVPPTHGEMLQALVAAFAEASRESVVVLEGLDYLARYAGSEAALRTLQVLRDLVTSHEGSIAVSFDPALVDDETRGAVERDFDPLALPAPRAPALEEVFVIHQSGLLVAHETRQTDSNVDRDAMAGMLTAVMNFARVSFSEGSDELRRLELGEKTVLIERGRHLILACVFRGTLAAEIDAEMRVFIGRAERRYGPLLEAWDGDVEGVSGVRAMTARLFI
jgi:hypothetical protein